MTRRHAELRGERAAVHRPGAAEQHQRELARIVAALDRHQPDPVGHRALIDAMDAAAASTTCQPEPLADARSTARAPPRDRAHRAAREIVGIEIAEHELASVTVGSVPPRP